MTEAQLVPLGDYREWPPDAMQRRAAQLYDEMRRRRSVRSFSPRPVPQQVIEDCLRTAGTAPSRANQQPWQFVVIEDPALKRRIRAAAEEVEAQFYQRRAPQAWLKALTPLGTGPEKPFLEEAPCLIAVFVQRYHLAPGGEKIRHYYPVVSVAIAVGMLITALHHAGLATLPYTPAPMHFLPQLLARPENEHPLMLLVVGYPAAGVLVPQLARKPLEEIVTFM